MAGRMRNLGVLIFAAFTLVDSNQNRRTKLPYIADAVGNSLPPPSSVPATVGSPVNLLTPDRYEFYTFDESGELVKRLMTLEEIQAIVAAGEEADGLVTFANENKPTMAFNFSQPSHTKVHNVVTNVKNVLKAQMEAHKNKPIVQPTFDTPDVSDSWSLILPSIFGNTGADIVPDKISGSFITPETETIEIDDLNTGFETSESKESNAIPSMSTAEDIQSSNQVSKSTLSTTVFPSTKSVISTTTELPKTTTKVLFTTTSAPIRTTSKPQTSSTTTRSQTTLPSKDSTSKNLTVNSNEIAYNYTTEKHSLNDDHKHLDSNVIKISPDSTTTIKPVAYEKVSTYTPASKIPSITKINNSPNVEDTISFKNGSLNKNITTYNSVPSTISNLLDIKENDYGKMNSTTITTQSVSPSTSVTSTELNKSDQLENDKPLDDDLRNNESQALLPLFDVAQSISQIASDLGNNFAPVPTSNSLLDTTKLNNIDIESKENIEIEIPTDTIIDNIENRTRDNDNFVKISTFDPHNKVNENESNIEDKEPTTVSSLFATTTISTDTVDPFFSVSMDDLLSQVVQDNANPTSIISPENNNNFEFTDITTDTKNIFENVEATTVNSLTAAEQYIANYTELSKEKTDLSNISTESNQTINNNEPFTTNIPETTTSIITDVLTSTETVINIKNISEIDKSNKSVTVGNFSDFQEKKRIADAKNVSQNLLTTNALHVNILSTASPASESTVYNKHISSSVLINKSNGNNQVKLSNQKQDLPKFDDFKKKIQKVNIDDKELANERNSSWKLIPTVSPPKINEIVKDKHKLEGFYTPESNDKDIILEFPKENQGLEVTTKDLGEDILQFSKLCNELAFQYWQILSDSSDKRRSIVFSPYSITSTLAMMFMGARGGTSGEMNEILKLDDMVTFNPHFTLKNISDSIETTSASGVAVSAFVRELFSERHKGKILTFYKERAQHFYNGHVEEINFDVISDIIRRRTNLLVKRYSWGKIVEYIKGNTISMNPPLASFSANIFQTDCTGSSTDGRDGEIYFVVSPNVRQRRLVPIPAVVYKSNFLAGYDPNLDATAAALGNTNSIISTLFLMPGQQGNVVHADDLEKLEKRLLNSSQNTLLWNGLLRTLLPRIGLELQIPRFSHKSIFNISSTLKTMGLKELFDKEHADLGGLNGPSKDLYLSDMLQVTSFATCGEGVIGEQHHVEEYPDTLELSQKYRTSRWLNGWDEPRDYQRAFHDPHDVGDAMHLPLHLRPRQARLPARNSQLARLKFDRPFIYFVRHNPSGMILYVGRYNPRLLP